MTNEEIANEVEYITSWLERHDMSARRYNDMLGAIALDYLGRQVGGRKTVREMMTVVLMLLSDRRNVGDDIQIAIDHLTELSEKLKADEELRK